MLAYIWNNKSKTFCGCHTVKTWDWLLGKGIFKGEIYCLTSWITGCHVSLAQSISPLLWVVVRSSSNSFLLLKLFLIIDFKMFVLYFILKNLHLYLLSMIVKQGSALAYSEVNCFNMYSHLLNDFLFKFARSSPSPSKMNETIVNYYWASFISLSLLNM